MKKFNSLAAVATVALASVFGFTSCQKDNDAFETSKSETVEEACDTLQLDSIAFENNAIFNYSNRGPVSADQAVGKLDFGYGVDQDAPRTRSAIATYAIATVSKTLLKWAAEEAYKNVKSKAFNAFLSKILDDDKQSMVTELNNINGKLEDVIAFAKNMNSQIYQTENARLMSERMDYYGSLNRITRDAFSAMTESSGDSASVAKIIDSWAGKMIKGNAAYLSTIQYMDFLSGKINSRSYSMPLIYDSYIYQTTPWEHEGYDNREYLRMADVSLSISSYLLAKLYCLLHEKEITDATLDASFNNFKTEYEKTIEVKRRDDVIVCQINGAHIEFNKQLVNRDIKNHPWRSDNDGFVMLKQSCKDSFIKKFFFGENGKTADDVLNRSLTPSEAEAIYNYYNSGKDDSEKLTLDQILANAGFDMSALVSGKKHVMTLNTGASIVNCGHSDSFSNDWAFKFDKAAVTSDNTFMVNTFHVGKEYLYCEWHWGKHSNSYYCKGWSEYDNNNQYFRTDIAKRVAD